MDDYRLEAQLARERKFVRANRGKEYKDFTLINSGYVAYNYKA